MVNNIVLQRFPTEKFKRFWYPTRPLFTITLDLFLASLGFIGILPMSWALWLSAAFAFDDLPLTPIMGVMTAMNNLYHGRKQTKAILNLVSIGLAVIIGGLLGFFVFSQQPLFILAITEFITATSCSPLLISIGAISGGLWAHHTNKVSPFSGITFGVLIASFLPFSLPLLLETVFLCAALSAFITSIITKQGLRAYHYYRYHHTNADGYELNKQNQDLMNQQAHLFQVTPDEFSRLATQCKTEIQTIKDKATFLEELGGIRQPKTNSWKDILHGLMRANTKEEAASVKQLLKDSTPSEVKEGLKREPDIKKNPFFLTSANLRSNLADRTLYHQINISPGIPEHLAEPFLTRL